MNTPLAPTPLTPGARSMDEEAAALQKEREETEKPPFLSLGTQGAQFVYYARRTEQLFHWNPREHTPVNLRFLAPVEWWQKTLDPDGKLTLRQVMDRALDYCTPSISFARRTNRNAPSCPWTMPGRENLFTCPASPFLPRLTTC